MHTFYEMDYFVQSYPLSEETKAVVAAWINTTLNDMSVECDDVMVQYVLVMINGGKTMQEISVELDAFIGKPECDQFALKYYIVQFDSIYLLFYYVD